MDQSVAEPEGGRAELVVDGRVDVGPVVERVATRLRLQIVHVHELTTCRRCTRLVSGQ